MAHHTPILFLITFKPTKTILGVKKWVGVVIFEISGLKYAKMGPNRSNFVIFPQKHGPMRKITSQQPLIQFYSFKLQNASFGHPYIEKQKNQEKKAMVG